MNTPLLVTFDRRKTVLASLADERFELLSALHSNTHTHTLTHTHTNTHSHSHTHTHIVIQCHHRLWGESKSPTRFLFSLAARIRNPDTPVEITDEEAMNEQLYQHFPDYVKPLFHAFVNKELNPRQQAATANLFHMLSFDVPVTAVVPRRMMTFAQQIFTCGVSKDYCGLRKAVEESLLISRHLGDFVLPFIPGPEETSKLVLALTFVYYCLDFVDKLSLVEPQAPQEIPNSYNPPRTGTAYYFTPSGL